MVVIAIFCWLSSYILAVVDGSRETLYDRILDSHPTWDVEIFDRQ